MLEIRICFGTDFIPKEFQHGGSWKTSLHKMLHNQRVGFPGDIKGVPQNFG